jgi:hypothetical protein
MPEKTLTKSLQRQRARTSSADWELVEAIGAKARWM